MHDMSCLIVPQTDLWKGKDAIQQSPVGADKLREGQTKVEVSKISNFSTAPPRFPCLDSFHWPAT